MEFIYIVISQAGAGQELCRLTLIYKIVEVVISTGFNGIFVLLIRLSTG